MSQEPDVFDSLDDEDSDLWNAIADLSGEDLYDPETGLEYEQDYERSDDHYEEPLDD